MKLKNYCLKPFVTAAAPRFMLRLFLFSKIINKYFQGDSYKCAELGPGLGDVAAVTESLDRFIQLDLIEEANTACKILKQRFSKSKKINIHHTNLSDFNNNNQYYDAFFMFEVLEHIEDDLLFMQQISSLQTVGGMLVMSVPSYMKKWQKQDVWAGHIRRYERNELVTVLEKSGYEIVEIVEYGFPLINILQPLKDLFYRHKVKSQLIDSSKKTGRSGVEGRLEKRLIISIVFFVCYVCSYIQFVFKKLPFGDGFICVARKRN